MRLCLSFQTEETLTFLGSNYLIILTPWAVASPQHIVCQGHCSGCFEASREAADKRQVLTTREMLSGGSEEDRSQQGEGRGGEERKRKCSGCWEEIVLREVSSRIEELGV